MRKPAFDLWMAREYILGRNWVNYNSDLQTCEYSLVSIIIILHNAALVAPFTAQFTRRLNCFYSLFVSVRLYACKHW